MGKGKEAAESVSEKLDEAAHDAKDAAEAAKTEAVEAKDRVSSAVTETAVEIRDDAKEAVAEAVTDAKEGAKAVQETVSAEAERVGEAVDGAVSDGVRAVEAGVDEAKAITAEAKETVEEGKKEAVETVAEIKESVEHEKDVVSYTVMEFLVSDDVNKAVAETLTDAKGGGKAVQDTGFAKAERIVEAVDKAVSDGFRAVQAGVDEAKAIAAEDKETVEEGKKEAVEAGAEDRESFEYEEVKMLSAVTFSDVNIYSDMKGATAEAVTDVEEVVKPLHEAFYVETARLDEDVVGAPFVGGMGVEAAVVEALATVFDCKDAMTVTPIRESVEHGKGEISSAVTETVVKIHSEVIDAVPEAVPDAKKGVELGQQAVSFEVEGVVEVLDMSVADPAIALEVGVDEAKASIAEDKKTTTEVKEDVPLDHKQSENGNRMEAGEKVADIKLALEVTQSVTAQAAKPCELAPASKVFEVDETIVSATLLSTCESAPKSVSGDACTEPVCVQKVVRRPSVDDNFPEVDLAQFREIDYDELHGRKGVLAPAHVSIRHTRDVSSIDQNPEVVEEFCVMRKVSDLTFTEHFEIPPHEHDASGVLIECMSEPLPGSDVDIATLTHMFLTQERKLADVPSDAFSLSSEGLKSRRHDDAESDLKILPDKRAGDPCTSGVVYEVPDQTDKSIEVSKVERDFSHAAAHEYDFTEQIKPPINLSFSEPSESYRPTDKEVFKSGQDEQFSHHFVPSDSLTTDNTAKSTPFFKPETDQSVLPCDSIRVLTTHTVEVDTSDIVSSDITGDQFVPKTTHTTSTVEIMASNKAQSSSDSVNVLTCTTEARELVAAPCTESYDFTGSADLERPRGNVMQRKEGYTPQLDDFVRHAIVVGKEMSEVALSLDSTVEEVSSDVTDVSITTVSDAVETGSSFELSDTSIERDSLASGEKFSQRESKVTVDCEINIHETAKIEVLESQTSCSTSLIGEQEDTILEDESKLDVLSQDLGPESYGKSLTRTDASKCGGKLESRLTKTEYRMATDRLPSSSHLIQHGTKSYKKKTASKDTAPVATRDLGTDKKSKLSISPVVSSSEGGTHRAVRHTTKRSTADLQSTRTAASRGTAGPLSIVSAVNVSPTQNKPRVTLEQKKTEYVSQAPAFNYMRTTFSREAKRSKDAPDMTEKSSSQKSSKEGTPTKKVPTAQQYSKTVSALHYSSTRPKDATPEQDSLDKKQKLTSNQKSSREGTPSRKTSTKTPSRIHSSSRPPSVSSTSSNRRVSESSSASSSKSSTRTKSEVAKEQSFKSSSGVVTRTNTVSQIASSVSRKNVISATKSVKKTVEINEPSAIKRQERSAVSTTSSRTLSRPSKISSRMVNKMTSDESVPSTCAGEDLDLTEPDSASLIQDEVASIEIPSPSEGISRRASSAPIPSTGEPIIHSLHPRLQTSLPASPSRLARVANQGLVTQLLTSEVFTRTVESTDAVEVVYHEPERQRRPTDGDQSFIDTTDSSLSESTAIPSSSTSSDRRRSRSASPKASKRSDVISTVDAAETVLCVIKEENGDTSAVGKLLFQAKPATMCDIPTIAVNTCSDELETTSKNTVKVLADDQGHATDIDVFETSDTGDDEEGHVSPGLAVDAYVEFENTVDETLNIKGCPSQCETASIRPASNMLQITKYEIRDGCTDIEDISDGEGDLEIEEVGYNEDELRIIDTILGEAGDVDIADALKDPLSALPSPSVTPDPGAFVQERKTTARSSKRSAKRGLLSPTLPYKQPEHAKSINRIKATGHRSRRRRNRSPKNMTPSPYSDNVTDIEDVDLSIAETVTDDAISRQLQSTPDGTSGCFSHRTSPSRNYVSAPDTEGEEMSISDSECFGALLNIPVADTTSVSPDIGDVLTDYEEVDFDRHELRGLQNIEELSSIRVSHEPRPHGLRYSSCSSSDDDVESKRKCSGKRKVPKIILQRADNAESSDHEESVEKQKGDSYLEGDGCATDREVVKLSEQSDVDELITRMSLNVVTDIGCVTDTEVFEDDDSLRPSTPEPDIDDSDERIPEPVRELTLLKEFEEGRPESVVLPLGDGRPEGLRVVSDETAGVTDVEYVQGESDDDEFDCKSPDLPDIDGGDIKATDTVKYQKIKTGVMTLGEDFFDSVTDNEDTYENGWSKKRRVRNKKGVKSMASLGVQQFRIVKSDIEEIELSDFEETNKDAVCTSFRRLTLNQEYEEKTDVESVSAASGLDDDDDECTRKLASPDVLQHLGGEIIASTEGFGPFSAKRREEITGYSADLGGILNVQVNSELGNTDVEDDFVTSPDEELVRSARVSLDTEQSVVVDKSVRKFNIDGPEEAKYVKGRLLCDAHTDVEEVGLSEEEITGRLVVVDRLPEVCVCVTSHENGSLGSSVCVCVSRNEGNLSLLCNTTDSAIGERVSASDVNASQEAEAPEEEEVDPAEEKH